MAKKKKSDKNSTTVLIAQTIILITAIINLIASIIKTSQVKRHTPLGLCPL